MTPSVAESQAVLTHTRAQQATVVIWGTWMAVASLLPKQALRGNTHQCIKLPSASRFSLIKQTYSTVKNVF